MSLLGIKLFVGGWLSYYDLRTLSVPVWALALYASIVIWQCPVHGISFSICAFFVCGVWVFERIKSQTYLGLADKILLSVVGMTIPPMQVGWFFITIGIVSLITALIWQKLANCARFPMMPAIILSDFICNSDTAFLS